MIRITVELLPLGSESRKRLLGTMEIVNTGKGTKTIGNYRYKLFGKNKKVMYSGELDNFKRKSWHVWKLIYLCLGEKYNKG